MIASRCFEREWIEAQRRALRAADPLILEKSIHALALLGALVRSNCDLVFKGGTALLLHLPEFRRLSIDIDIVCPEPQAGFERRLDGILPGTPFVRWQPDERGIERLPRRRHYKLFYPSPTGGREDHIVLDVVEEPNVIADLAELPIATRFVECEAELRVRVPTVEALLGDKMTAFAPNTVGIPLTDRSCQQVLKQLFDIGQLYDRAADFAGFRRANLACYEAEAGYRGSQAGSYEDYLQDVIDTSLGVCLLQFDGAPQDATPGPRRELLHRGLRALANHLVGGRFGPAQASVAAARAALLARQLAPGHARAPAFHRWNATDRALVEQLAAAQPVLDHRGVRRLKKASVEAYYYWCI